MNPIVPVAAVALPVIIALLARGGKAKAAAPPTPAREPEPPAPSDATAQEAHMHAREAAAEAERHDAAAQAKAQAEAEAAELAAIAERARVVSESAAAKRAEAEAILAAAEQQKAAAARAAQEAQAEQNAAKAAAAQQAAQQAAAAEAAAKQQQQEQLAAQAQAETEKQEAERRKAAAEAKAAEQERLRAEAEAKARAERQAAADAARAALAAKQQEAAQKQQRARDAARMLAAYLAKPGADFGIKGRPSEPVRLFQVAAGLTDDGIVGPEVRNAASALGASLPARRKEAVKPAPVPPTEKVAAPAHPPAESLVVQQPVIVQTEMGPQRSTVPVAAPPPGYDPTLAKTLAHDLERHLLAVAKKYPAAQRSGHYDRNLTRRFQTAAGIDADGLYGGTTRGAIVFYRGTNAAPSPFMKPLATIDYKPPGGALAA